MKRRLKKGRIQGTVKGTRRRKAVIGIGVMILTVIVILLIVLSALRISSLPGVGRELAEKAGVAYPAVIAHRGLSHNAPESTEHAYRLAREFEVDYLEADVQRTSDGYLVVYHDDRVTSEKTDVQNHFPDREGDPLSSFTLEELQQLDIGSWFNEKYPDRSRSFYKGAGILTLKDLIGLVIGFEKTGLYLETKSPESQPGIEEDLINVLEESGYNGSLVFQSFSLDSLKRLRELRPEIPRVLLIREETAKERGFNSIVDEAKYFVDGIGPVGHLAYPKHTGYAHREGLFVHHYTVNDAWMMQLFHFFGSDGFFTDRGDLAVELLKNR